MDDLRNALKDLGLSGHEPAVYAALLEQSPAGAAVIARKCGLSRSSVYTTLGVLTAKGLVGTTHRDEVKQFVAEGHHALLELLERQKSEAEARVKLAQSLSTRLEQLTAEAHLPQLAHFEGQQGLKRIYLAMLREARAGAELCILRDEFIWRAEWSFVFEAQWRERVRRFKAEKRLTTRLLVNRSSEERAKAKYYRSREGLEVRYLARPVKAFGLYVVGDSAAILSFEHQNLLGIRMVNANLSANLKTMFDGLWASGARRAPA